jgi:hypothetical protein
MIYSIPLRLTTLHLAQRFLIDGDTFIISLLLNPTTWLYCQSLNYTCLSNFRPEQIFKLWIKGLSGLEVLLR